MPWAAPDRAAGASTSARHRNAARYRGSGRTWATPPEVFTPLEREFGFTLDPCATPDSAKCARYFTEADDGLAQSWAGETVFMNPPYGRELAAWVSKARRESTAGATVVGLLPAATDQAWFHDDVIGAGAEVRFLRGRVRFLGPGDTWASPFQPSIVVVWRP
jgi:phage N-6-adenine-methyltransferase